MKNSKKIRIILLCICLFSLKAVAENTVSFNFTQPIITLQNGINSVNGNMDTNDRSNFRVIAHDEEGKRADFNFNISQSSPTNTSFQLNNGDRSIPVNISVRSDYNSVGATSGWEPLQSSSAISSWYKGANSVSDTYGGSQIQFSLSGTIYDLRAGTYEATFLLNVTSGGVIKTQYITVQYIVPSWVQITGLQDLTLTGSNHTQAYVGTEGFCVFSTTNDMFITAQGDPSDDGRFFLHNGNHKLPYLPFLMRMDGNSKTTLPYGVKVDPSADMVNCNNTKNIRLTVDIFYNETKLAVAGVYTGTLYLTAEPQ